jgi:hypothetical protein
MSTTIGARNNSSRTSRIGSFSFKEARNSNLQVALKFRSIISDALSLSFLFVASSLPSSLLLLLLLLLGAASR